MDPRPDHYDILGVEKDASPEAIRAAFVRASKAAHPDHGGTNALFRLVRLSHDTLADPHRRAAYDLELQQSSRPVLVLRPPSPQRADDAGEKRTTANRPHQRPSVRSALPPHASARTLAFWTLVIGAPLVVLIAGGFAVTSTRQPATTTTTVEVGSVLSEGVVTSLLPAPNLPAEFPGDRVPLPRGAVVQRVATGTDQGYLDYFLQLGLPGQTDAKAAADAYGGAMRPLGWTQVPLPSSVLVDTPSDVYVISFSNARQELVTLFVDPSGSGLRGSLTYQRPS